MKYILIPLVFLISACTTHLVPELKRLDVPDELMQPMPDNLNKVEVDKNDSGRS